MRYSLRQLEVFLATARHENVTRAAHALAMSQSAASGALKELENQFEVQLFDRVGKRLRLNATGERLRPLAESLLEQAELVQQSLAGGDIAGRVHVGATLTIGNYMAVDIIADFKQRQPQVDMDLVIANTEDIAARVARFELDIGLIEGELHHPDIHIEHWRRDELVVFAAPDHPLVGKRRVSDRDLRQLPWIVRERGSGTRQAFDRAMHGILPDLNISLELQQPKAIKRAVESGLGVGCLSRISVERAFERGELTPLAVPHRDFQREWFLIWHRDKYHGAPLDAWIELCRQSWS